MDSTETNRLELKFAEEAKDYQLRRKIIQVAIPGGEKHPCHLWHKLAQLSQLKDGGEIVEGGLLSYVAFQEAWTIKKGR